MGVNCNVIPQIKVNENYEDSKCFTELWDRAKRLYPFEPIKAREAAKTNYAALKSDNFTSIFGDWQLLRKIQHNDMTNADLATFSSIYGNNLSKLKESIIVELNEQGEPKMSALDAMQATKKSEVIFDANYPFLNDSEHMYLNRIFAAMVYRLEPEINKLTVKEFNKGIKIRNIIANGLEMYANHNNASQFGYKSFITLANERFTEVLNTYRDPAKLDVVKEEAKATWDGKTPFGVHLKKYLHDRIRERDDLYKSYMSKADNLIALANELRNADNHNVWGTFVNYYKATFHADIVDFDLLSEEDALTMGEINGNGNAVTNEANLITKSWNDSLQFKTNRKNTVSLSFKRFLSSMIYNNQGNLFADVKDTQLNGTSTYYNKYGLVMPFDVNMIWNSLINITYDHTSKAGLANSIKVLSDQTYNSQLQPLVDMLTDNPTDTTEVKEEKDIFYNNFCAACFMAMSPVTKSTTEKYDVSGSNYSVRYEVSQVNRDSFATTYLYDRYRTALTDKFQYLPDRASLPTNIVYNGTNDEMTNSINRVILKSNAFGINWTLDTVLNYIAQKFNVDFLALKDAHRNADSERYLSPQTVSLIDADLTKVDRAFDEILSAVSGKISNKDTKAAKARQARAVKSLFKKGFKANTEMNMIVDDNKGYISVLAKVGACNPAIKTDLSYINVEGEQEYTPEFFNHITSLLQGCVNKLGVVNEDLMVVKFNDYITSSANLYNYFIWNFGDNKGFFNFKKNADGTPVIENGNYVLNPDHPVNTEGVTAFKYGRFNGLSNPDSGIGTPYVDMHDYVWTNDVILRQLQGHYSLPSADASRIYEFLTGNTVTDFEAVTKILKYDYFNNDGTFAKYSTLRRTDIANNFMYQRVYNTLKSELHDMLVARQLLFDYDTATGKLTPKQDFLRSDEELKEMYANLSESTLEERLQIYGSYEASFANFVEKNKLNKDILAPLQSPIFWNGKELLDDNGNPTGNIFKLGNLNFRYTDADGNISVRSIIDYLPAAYAQLNGTTDTSKFGTPQPYMICDETFNLDNNNVLDIAFMMLFSDRMNAQLAEAIDFLRPVRNHIQSSGAYKNNVKVLGERATEDMNSDRNWSFVLAHMMMNHYTADIAIQEIFTGKTYEFKNAIDWAKRASQNSRTGSRTLSTGSYSQIIVKDVKLKDNMLDIITKDLSEDMARVIRQRFSADITTTDAFNIITEDECIRRFKAKGDYDTFNLPSGNTLQDLIDGDKPIDSRDYAAILQQLKYYYYDRTQSTMNNRFKTDLMFSHQDKNSTLAIFKNMYKGTKYETLTDWMKQEGINSINFESGHKVGAEPGVQLFSVTNNGKDANLNIFLDEATGRLELKGYPSGIKEYIHTRDYTNLYTQQQIPSHLLDQKNKIGTQLEKRILDGLSFNGEYIIDGLIRKGKTGSFDYDSAGTFEHYQMLLSSNANDEMYRLLQDWGAVDNKGNIKYKDVVIDGVSRKLINVDFNLLMEDLQQYFNDTETDLNFKKAVQIVDGKPFIPLYHPTIKSRIESVLLARITNRITNLKLKGGHVTIQPDTFLSPASVTLDKKGFTVGTNENVAKMYNNGQIRFSKDYWQSRAELDENGNIKYDAEGNVIVKKDADFKLKSEYWEDGVFHPAEIILNNWDSRFKLDENGYLNLDTIPNELKTMFGIRIPTEGHQSMFVCKVVGVLNNNASQAIVPEHLITRTGWDFDIDSIYLSMKEFDIIDGKYVEYKIDSKNPEVAAHIKQQSVDYVAKTYFATEANKLHKNYLDKKIPLVNELSDIYEIINGSQLQSTDEIKLLNDQLKELRKNYFYSKSKSERESLNKAMESLTAEIEAYNTNEADKSLPDGELKRAYERKSELQQKIKEVTAEYNKAYKEFIDSTVMPKWDSLSVYNRATRAAKDNAIIDVWIGIHSDPKTLALKEKPNEFSHSSDIADYVNRIAGYDNSNMNQHFIIDQIKIRNINNNIAVLKGQSIAADNALSIMGLTETRLVDEFAIPMKINFKDIVGYSDDIKNKNEWVKKALLKCFKQEKLSNGESVIDVSIEGEYATVWCRSLYNNDYGDWLDINGQTIMEQRSELTSHILDAVKQNMGFNSNTYTIGDLALLSSFPISWNTDLKTKGKQVLGVNRYTMPVLLESQAIISDFVTDISIQSLDGSNNFTNYSFHKVRSDYMIDMIRAMGTILKEKGVSLKAFYGKNSEIQNDIKEILIAINRDIEDTDIKLSDLSQSHNRINVSVKPNQVYALAKIMEEIANEAEVNSYEINAPLKTKARTITELDQSFKDGIKFRKAIESPKDYANFLSNQLDILDYYMHIDKAVNAMKRAQGVLITEKKGAGPKTSESNKLFNSIANLQHNVDTVIARAKDVGVPTTLQESLRYEYYSVNDITEKGKVIDKYITIFNDWLSESFDNDGKQKSVTKPKSPFAIGDKSMVEAIFPSIVNNNWDIKDSAYPILQQQLYSTNELSTNLFHDVFLSENPVFRDKLNYIMSRLGQVNNPELRENLINYAIMYKVREMPFFNTYNSISEGLTDRARLLGTITITNDPTSPDGPTFRGTADLSYAGMTLKDMYDPEDPFKELSHKEKLDIFNTLPVALQLKLVANSFTEGVVSFNSNNTVPVADGNLQLNPNHILALLVPNTMVNTILSKGYMGIATMESDDLDYTRDTFRDLLNSPDDFCRTLGENLIRYAFWVNKFDFGRNLSKYIPVDVYGKTRGINGEPVTTLLNKWGDQFDTINFDQLDGTTDAAKRQLLAEQGITNGGVTFRSYENSIAQYADALYASETTTDNVLLGSEVELEEFIEAFVRANADNTRIVRNMAPEYDYSKKKKTVKHNTPTFQKVTKGGISKAVTGSSEVSVAGKWDESMPADVANLIENALNSIPLYKHHDVWDVVEQMIIEPTSKVENSKYANDRYLKSKEPLLGNDLKGLKKAAKSFAVKGKLYKRFDINECTIYYPISRTFKNEYINTCCDYFKYNIESKEIYEKIGIILSKFYRVNEPKVDTVKEYNSISEAVVGLTNDSDRTLYIGDSNDHVARFTDESKTIYIPMENFLNKDFYVPNSGNETLHLTILSESKPLSEAERLVNQGKLFKALNRLIQSQNVNKVSAIQTEGANRIIVDYLGMNKDVESVVGTVKENVKFSEIIDTQFISDTDNSGISVGDMEFVNTLYEVEKQAIGNTRLLRDEMAIMGDLTTSLEKLDNAAARKIESLSKDFNTIGDYVETFKYNKNVLDEVKNMIEKIDINLDTANIVELYKRGNSAIRRQWVNDLNKLSRLIQSQEYIDRLNPITAATDNMSYGLKEDIDKFNEAVISLKEQYAELIPLKLKVAEASKEYFSSMIAVKGHNPYFNTKFKHIQDELVKNGFDSSLTEDFKLTREMIADNIKKAMGDNLDLSFMIKWLDSAAQTGIPLIDTVLAQYEFHALNSEEFAINKHKEAIGLFKKYDRFFKTKSNGKPNMKFSQSQSDDFKAKFINERTAQLITPFDEEQARRELDVFKAKAYDDFMEANRRLIYIMEHTGKADIRIDAQREYAANYKKFKASIEKYSSKYLTTVKLNLPIKTVGTKFVVEWDKMYADPTKYFKGFTYNEAYYYVKLLERIRNASSIKKYAQTNKVKFISVDRTSTELPTVIKLPTVKYRDAKFANLNENDIEMLLEMQELFADLNTAAMPNTYKPASFFPTFISASNMDIIKGLIGWRNIEEDDYINTLNGETQYYLKASALNTPKVKGQYKFDFYDAKEVDNYDNIIESANKMAKRRGYHKEIKTIQDVNDYNYYVKDKQIETVKDRMNYDPFNVTLNYIEQLKRVKINRDFEPDLLLLQNVLSMSGFEARNEAYKGKNIVNKILSAITHKTEVVTKKGKDTDAYGRLKTWFDMFEGKNRINNTSDQILNMFHTVNSKTLMWANITAALKNVGTGHINIVSEATGGEFTTTDTLLKAHAMYIKALPSLLASAGELTTDNLDAALMKFAGNIFEDQNEASVDNKENAIKLGIAKWDNAMYLPNTIGEHYLQFATFLSAMQTHRIVNGVIMNYEQYTFRLRETLFMEMLPEDKLKDYEVYKAKDKAKRGNNIEFIDYVSNFLAYKDNNLGKEFKSNYAKAYKEKMNHAKEEFNKLTSIYDSFELVDGLAEIKADSGIDKEEFAKFLGKVKGVNHSLHGIYNTFDKSALSGSMIGEVILQFRKWLRPNFVRYWGKRVGKSVFDERLESYRSGAYWDAMKFINAVPRESYNAVLDKARENLDEGEHLEFTTYMKAIANYLYGWMRFAKDWSVRWTVLPEAQKANIKRAAFNSLSLALLTTAAGLAYAAADDDDELDQNIAFAMLAYAIYGTQTELYETSPMGLYSFYKRTMEAPIPFETTLGNLLSVLYYTLGWFILDEEDLVYDRGTYKGRSKLSVNASKLIPVYNQGSKLIYLPKNNNYYMKQNPLLQMIVDLNK